MQGIVVIQTAFLGDIVLASGFLRTLRKRNPGARITFVTTEIGKEILSPNPWNLDIVVFDKRGEDKGWKGFWRIVEAVRQGKKADAAYCLHRYLRSSLLARFVARKVYGFREAAGAFLYSQRVTHADYTFESERYLALLGDYSRDDLLPELHFSDADREAGEALLAELGGAPFLAIAPSSVWATKRWQAEKFAAVARWAWKKHNIRSVILGGPDATDRNVAGQVAYYYVHVQGGTKQLEGIPLNLSGQTSLGTLKYVISRAKAVVANDSAPLHIAIAMDRPVVGVFGPTTKAAGFFPLGKEGETDYAEIDLYCRPCGRHGHNRCPEAHFRCMVELPATVVQAKLESFLCR